MKPTLPLSFLFVFLTGLLFAFQALALDPARSIVQYTHTKWTIADGAPADIKSIVQSADGYLWLGTSTGLYRFDGITFEQIPPIEGDTSRSESITALLALPSGDVWVGYYYGGIAVYHDGKLHDFNHGRPEGSVQAFARDADGGVWVATFGLNPIGLSRYRNGKWQTFDADSGIPHQYFKGILAAPDGTVWVVTRDSVSMMRRGSNRFERVGEQLSILARDGIGVAKVGLAMDSQNRAWISDCRGVGLLDNGPGIGAVTDGALAQGPCPREGAVPQTIIFDRDGSVWGSTDSDGIVRIRPTSMAEPQTERALPPGSGDAFRATEGLSSNTTSGIVEDREGDIWIGTSSGLDRFRAANVVVETAIPPPAGNHYFAARDANGTIVIGDGHKFYQILPNADPVVASEVISGLVTHICANADGKHWFQTADNNISEVEQGHHIKSQTLSYPHHQIFLDVPSINMARCGFQSEKVSIDSMEVIGRNSTH